MKMRILMLLTLIAGALLQQLLPVWPLFGGVKPPILASLALYYALRRDHADMWLAIIAAALLRDGLDLGPFGTAMIVFPVIGIIAQRIRNEVFSDGFFTQLTFGALLGLSITFVALFIYGITGQRPLHLGIAMLRLFGSFCLGMITFPMVSLAINKLEAALPKRRRYGWQ